MTTAAKQADPIADRTTDSVAAALRAAGVDADAVAEIARLHAFACERGLSVKALAGLTHMSDSSVSQLFAAKYPGNYTQRAAHIVRFFHDEENRRIFGGVKDFVQTATARMLWRIFERTRYNRRIQIVQSEEQLGKSRAAEQYAVEHNSGRTILLQLAEAGLSNPFGIFLRDLALACSVTVDHVKALDIRYKILRSLEACDLVIIDEFHLVESWPDKAVRALLDFLRIQVHANGRRGIVLIATNSDVMTLLEAFRASARYNLGQLIGRMNNETLELYADDIPIDDVRLFVERYYKPGKAVVSKLHDIACRPKLGHFGLLDDILGAAWATAQLDRIPMSDDLVLGIAREKLDDLAKRHNKQH
jgi:hypothetical protein